MLRRYRVCCGELTPAKTLHCYLLTLMIRSGYFMVLCYYIFNTFLTLERSKVYSNNRALRFSFDNDVIFKILLYFAFFILN